MAMTQLSFTSTAPPASQQQPNASQLQLPPPQIFDILPILHELLARIDHGAIDPAAGLIDHTLSDPEDIGALYSELQQLEPKEILTEVLPIKRKIREALKELEKLPDMERSVEEQNEEIEELEGKIRRQRAMIARLGELARGMQEKIG